MTTNQYISVRETAQLLSVSEKKVMDLIEERKLQAYRIADKFLRLKKTEVMALRSSDAVPAENKTIEYSRSERLKDFFYFNDFYVLSIVTVTILLYMIFYS